MAVAIHNGSVSKKERILQTALKSPIHFGQLFMPKDFMTKTASKYHYEVGNIIDDKKNIKPVILMLPRGHAKTKMTQASILKDIATYDYDEDALKRHFIVWVAQNKTQSMRNVNFIKNQIETNDVLKYYFGNLKNKGNKKWNQEELDFSNECSLICRAGLHGIRGLLKDELRPNRFILDDFEYEGNTKTLTSRNANAETVTSVIIPALDNTIGRLQINQTPVHYDCFVMRVKDNFDQFIKENGNPHDFEWIVYTKPTTIAEPLWPEYFSSEMLKRTKSKLFQIGQLHTWFQEYEMEVTSSETALFGQKVIRYWEGNLIRNSATMMLHVVSINGKEVNEYVEVLTFTGTDPSSDIETRTSSDTSIIEIAVDYRGRVFVLDYLVKKNLPDIALEKDTLKMGTANQILIRSKKINSRRSGVEKHAISSGVFNSIALLKEKEPKYRDVVIVPLSHKSERKIDRIYNGLISYFNSGNIIIRDTHSRLETEIKTFGEFAKHMDILDSLEMAVRVSYRPSKTSKPKKEEKNEIILEEYEKRNQTEHKSNWKTV